MLNLLIAFISDSYEEVVSKKAPSFAYERINIISEIDKTLGNSFLKKLDLELKDSFLYVAKSQKDEEDENLGDGEKHKTRDRVAHIEKKVRLILLINYYHFFNVNRLMIYLLNSMSLTKMLTKSLMK